MSAVALPSVRSLLAIAVFALLLLGVGGGAAAQSVGIAPTFNRALYYQGDSGNVSARITNTGDTPERVTLVTLEFDWGALFTLDVSATSSWLVPGAFESYSLSFDIPASVAVGHRDYTIRVYFLAAVDGGGTTSERDSRTGSLYVEDQYKPLADAQQAAAAAVIAELLGRTWDSTTAAGLAAQAQQSYALANQQYASRNYRDAAANYAVAIDLGNQALETEQSHDFGQAVILGSALGIALLVLTVLVLWFVVFRRRRGPG